MSKKKTPKQLILFRNGPVPNVRDWHSVGCIYRAPGTTQELRYSCLTPEEKAEGWKVRGSRNRRNLPNSWYDIYRSNMQVRNWKHFRRHQWKDR